MVTITKKVTLESQSSDPSDTILNAVGKPNGIVVYGSSAAGTVIEGFTVENADNHGIYVQDSYQVIITNNLVNHNGLNIIKGLGEDKAIQLTGTSNSTVADNRAVGNLYGGIGVADDGRVNPSWNSTAVPSAGIPSGSANPGNNNVISGNAVLENKPNHCAIVVSSYNPGEGVKDNVVSDNVVADNQNGIIVAADTPNTSAVNNTVIGNEILNNGEGGVVVHSNAPGCVVVGNAIVNNVFSGNGPSPPQKLVGIIVGGEDADPSVAVKNTTIAGNTFQDEYYGIQVVNGRQTLVEGNTMGTTVRVPVNGTVTIISVGTVSSGGATAPAIPPLIGNLPLAIVISISTLIIGVIIGIIVKPTRQ
jgi:parallel beta-helix repeat protein